MAADDLQQLMKYMRRHEANVFNAIFFDTENVTEEDVRCVIADVASFFHLPEPEISTKCETFAEVLVGEQAEQCEMSYNIEMLKEAGINNRDAFTLCFVHEMAHQLLWPHQFVLFRCERWMQELAADLTAGLYAESHLLATGKYKYALSRQKYSLTHPDGCLRKEIVEYGRHYWERKQASGEEILSVVMQIMPSFFFMHQEKLDEDWFLLIDELKAPPQQARPYVVEELPDTNLLKQAVERCKKSKNKKNESHR